MQASKFVIVGAAGALAAFPALASAQTLPVRVTIENVAPQNSVSFAPLRLAFNAGVYDSFDINQAAGPAIISIAEGGSGSDWFPAFMAADATANLGSVLGPVVPPLLPGQTSFAEFTVDTDVNPFFTFATMVVPSNDLFLGNDNPQQYRLFDDDGNLLITQIEQFGRQIWDANSETAIVANGAFIPGSNNDARVDEGGVVEFDLSELAVYDGQTTVPGYTFDADLVTDDTLVYRISFEVVPEPASASLLALCGLCLRRRRIA